MKLVAVAAIVALLAVPTASPRRHADRDRRPRLHDHVDAERQEGHDAEGRHLHVHDRRQVDHPQLPPDRPGRQQDDLGRRTGSKTWKLTLKKGTYKYVCDPHKSFMKGSFKVT